MPGGALPSSHRRYASVVASPSATASLDTDFVAKRVDLHPGGGAIERPIRPRSRLLWLLPRMTVCDGPFLLTGFLKGVFWISA